MFSRDIIRYPDQYVHLLNELVRRVQVLEMEVSKLKKERNS